MIDAETVAKWKREATYQFKAATRVRMIELCEALQNALAENERLRSTLSRFDDPLDLPHKPSMLNPERCGLCNLPWPCFTAVVKSVLGPS